MKSAVVFFVLLIGSTVQAAPVYSEDIGAWHLKGYLGTNGGSCVMTTEWDQGSHINLNVFPRSKGRAYVTLTIFNPKWDLVTTDYFPTTLKFFSRYGNQDFEGKSELKNSHEVIFRDLTGDFLKSFTKSRSLLIFPKSPAFMQVNLEGTLALYQAISDCKDVVGTSTGDYYSPGEVPVRNHGLNH